MPTLEIPDPSTLENVDDASIADFPPFASVRREQTPPRVDDVATATRAALEEIPAVDELDDGAEVALTVGSRGIHDMPELVETTVEELQNRGLEPFVIPAMGSHGGATPDGQVEVLESYGLTEERLGCEVRPKMSVETIATDKEGRPIPVSTVALEADAVLLANRVKVHTDFRGEVESGLCKMAVVGLGKQRGAVAMHNAGLSRGLGTVIPERAEQVFEHAPVIGGVALIDNAEDRAAHIEGVPVTDLLTREPELLERSKELLPELPVEDLDLLIVDELGKDISGTGLDTNVIGRYMFGDEPEPETPDVDRIAVRGMTDASHGNGLGMGLADYAHEALVEELDLDDVYQNVIASGEPARARIPIVVPCDRTMLLVAYSMTAVRDPADFRVGYIPNTLEPGTLYVSEPVVDELAEREDTTVDDPKPLTFDANGDFAFGFDAH